MKNGDQPINYCMMQQVGDTSFRANRFNDPKEYNRPMIGLTKREYFAAMAMNSIHDEVSHLTISYISKQLGIEEDEYKYDIHYDQFFAIRCKERANSLLKELED